VSTADTTTNAEFLTIDETIGNRFALDPDPGSRFYTVGVSGAIHPNSFGRLLSAYMGASAMTTPATGTTTRQHVFDPVANPTPIWHTITVARVDPTPDIVDSYWDALGGTLTFNVSPNTYFTYDGDFIARKLDRTQTTPTPTVDSTPKFGFDKVTVYITIGAGTEAALSCESCSMTLNNNIDSDFVVLGNIEPYSLAQGNADITGTFRTREALNTHYGNSLLTSQSPYKIRVLAEGAVVETTIKWTAEFTVERAFLEAASAPISAADVLKGIDINFRGAYNTSTSKAFTARIINTVSTAF
jgi:Phage tail tube protein